MAPAKTRIRTRARHGEEIDKAEVVKGYEYDRGHFVTFTDAVLNVSLAKGQNR
jgi:non-homologous end joining protein Ku